uniref:Uncharacterized protein n=1 Tax=Arundo donax TaxID=35708 RepID=A0A0A8Z0A5_ARUDO
MRNLITIKQPRIRLAYSSNNTSASSCFSCNSMHHLLILQRWPPYKTVSSGSGGRPGRPAPAITGQPARARALRRALRACVSVCGVCGSQEMDPSKKNKTVSSTSDDLGTDPTTPDPTPPMPLIRKQRTFTESPHRKQEVACFLISSGVSLSLRTQK